MSKESGSGVHLVQVRVTKLEPITPERISKHRTSGGMDTTDRR